MLGLVFNLALRWQVDLLSSGQPSLQSKEKGLLL